MESKTLTVTAYNFEAKFCPYHNFVIDQQGNKAKICSVQLRTKIQMLTDCLNKTMLRYAAKFDKDSKALAVDLSKLV